MNYFSFIFLFLILSQSACTKKTITFFGSYNKDKTKDGIYIYKLNRQSGKLSLISSAKNILNPSFLTVSEKGNFIFSCTESKTTNAGSVSSFKFDLKTKSIEYINSQKSGGENPVYLSLYKNEKWLINGNYTGGSISVYPIDSNGQILPIAQNLIFKDSSIHLKSQKSAHIHSVNFSPNYLQVFCPDLGADKIRIFSFDSNKIAPLSNERFAKTTKGSGPRHLTFHPNGKYIYCLEELSGTISGYIYQNGWMDSLFRIKNHSDDIIENFESSDIHISPDGKYLYAANRGIQNNIFIYKIEQNGYLTFIKNQASGGNHSRVFEMDASGRFLIATHTNSHNVVVFKRNRKSGLLKKVNHEIIIPNVSCVKMKDLK